MSISASDEETRHSSRDSASSASDEEALNKDTTDNGDIVMGNIMAKILQKGSTAATPSADAKDTSTTTTTANVVLSRRKALERTITETAVERQARAILRREERASREACHAHQPAIDNEEKALRKVALRGVVRLFNAVHQHQSKKRRAVEEEEERKKRKLDAARLGIVTDADTASAVGKTGKTAASASTASDAKAISKASFLELLKMGTAKKN